MPRSCVAFDGLSQTTPRLIGEWKSARATSSIWVSFRKAPSAAVHACSRTSASSVPATGGTPPVYKKRSTSRSTHRIAEYSVSATSCQRARPAIATVRARPSSSALSGAARSSAARWVAIARSSRPSRRSTRGRGVARQSERTYAGALVSTTVSRWPERYSRLARRPAAKQYFTSPHDDRTELLELASISTVAIASGGRAEPARRRTRSRTALRRRRLGRRAGAERKELGGTSAVLSVLHVENHEQSENCGLTEMWRHLGQPAQMSRHARTADGHVLCSDARPKAPLSPLVQSPRLSVFSQ